MIFRCFFGRLWPFHAALGAWMPWGPGWSNRRARSAWPAVWPQRLGRIVSISWGRSSMKSVTSIGVLGVIVMSLLYYIYYVYIMYMCIYIYKILNKLHMFNIMTIMTPMVNTIYIYTILNKLNNDICHENFQWWYSDDILSLFSRTSSS